LSRRSAAKVQVPPSSRSIWIVGTPSSNVGHHVEERHVSSSSAGIVAFSWGSRFFSSVASVQNLLPPSAGIATLICEAPPKERPDD
jgi:hypothetical protein